MTRRTIETKQGPITVKGPIAADRYTPKRLCKLLSACDAGLRTIQRYYKTWGRAQLSLREIIEHVCPERDFFPYETYRIRPHYDYPLRGWRDLIERVTSAAESAAVFSELPFLWRERYDESGYDTSLSSMMDWLRSVIDIPRSWNADRLDIVYQLLHDLAEGLVEVEINEVRVYDAEKEFYAIEKSKEKK